jgi:tyrosinase
MAHDKLVSSGNGPVAITPISLEGLDSNDLPQRRNVETWYAAAQAGGEELLQLTLFIEAMQEFQSGPKEDQLSYFRIAGIHSFPRNVSWNEDKAPDPVNPVEYCPHNRIVFPTWHRAYMMLFEVGLRERGGGHLPSCPCNDTAVLTPTPHSAALATS